MIQILHNNRCSKSRCTLEYLNDNEIEHEVVNYLEKDWTVASLKELVAMLQIPAKDLVRKNEKIFKEQFKDKEFSEEEWIKIMVAHPSLIERPIVIKDGKAVIGRPIEKVYELLGGNHPIK